MNLFPGLHGRSIQWNANELALILDSDKTKNIVKAGTSERLLETGRRLFRTEHLHGGWMENRSHILKDTYLEPSKFLHLGVDYFVPAGTPVAHWQQGFVRQLYCDIPEECGWGTRVMIQLEWYDITLIYGHLAKDSIQVKVGDYINANTTIGYVGDRKENGNWSPHLHVQAIVGDIQPYLDDPASLDGYGELKDMYELIGRFPDPTWYVS